MEINREEFEEKIKHEVTALFEQALDYADVACPDATYKKLRSKILRVGNNCIRNLIKELDREEWSIYESE